ncbi:hypothetical protein OS965_32825 [Streptomyces sp. H27-G5]|uniref:hypothetical protein n=1 Tax=Streptomyces sp. H27-G5 TaxID=2996698 RepID=UPI0022705CA3|nr:hypothetical protein [Streptomyces sp. H27-G5]MCY0922874.1 hypothetical protein [Streptomyces sp. H27-G5]
MFTAGELVEIVSCQDDPRAIGRTGRIVDEIPPGPLTAGRWTVGSISWLIAPVLCHGYELRSITPRRTR